MNNTEMNKFHEWLFNYTDRDLLERLESMGYSHSQAIELVTYRDVYILKYGNPFQQ